MTNTNPLTETNKLRILKASLIKKEAILNQRFENHFTSVKEANGQPLNDKRNGKATLNHWDKQSQAIASQKKSIEKTKNAISIEVDKITDTEKAKEVLPAVILKMLETKQLTQWRKHPNTFFVQGVDKARIVFDPKRNAVFTRYKGSIKEPDVWKLFASAFNTILNQLTNRG